MTDKDKKALLEMAERHIKLGQMLQLKAETAIKKMIEKQKKRIALQLTVCYNNFRKSINCTQKHKAIRLNYYSRFRV